MAEVTGYVRPRGGKLQAVMVVDGRKVRKTMALDVGQEVEAEAVLAAALEQLRSDPIAGAGSLTVKAWGKRWIRDRKARGKAEWVNEETHLEAFLYPVLGERSLAAVRDVELLDWVRGLEKMHGPSGKAPSPTYIRKITASVRALFKEAVRQHRIERTPAIWEDGDLPELEANARVIGAGFELEDVRRLIYDPRVPEDRRTLYALEFLTGLRTGEAAARTWKDWEPVYRGELGRLVAATSYNTRHRVVKETKTRVEKWIPVHPALAELLDAWKREGWERHWGRAPEPADLIVPPKLYSREKPQPRNNSYSWRCFRDDLVTLGLAHQRHYESRSTFINLAEAGGADPGDVARLPTRRSARRRTSTAGSRSSGRACAPRCGRSPSAPYLRGGHSPGHSRRMSDPRMGGIPRQRGNMPKQRETAEHGNRRRARPPGIAGLA